MRGFLKERNQRGKQEDGHDADDDREEEGEVGGHSSGLDFLYF